MIRFRRKRKMLVSAST